MSISLVSTGLTAAVAALHTYFFVLEAVLWEHPIGLKTFRNTPQKAKDSKVLAMNQGLYNLFLTAGLAWSLFEANKPNLYFFHGCVTYGFTQLFFFFFFSRNKIIISYSVAGLFGAATVGKKILYVQAAPAIAAIASLYLL